jgi:hypothetical protein
MDQLRQIRLVFGPSVLFFSLLIGAWSNGTLTWFAEDLGEKGSAIAAIVGIAVAAILPAGFAIGGLTTLLLSGAWWVCSRRNHYAAHLKEDAWKKLFSELESLRDPEHEGWSMMWTRLYAVATFVRIRLAKEIHDGPMHSRYQAFNAYATGCVALVLSHGVGRLIGMEETWTWRWITVSLFVVFLGAATLTWRELMKLLECAVLSSDKDRYRCTKSKTHS